MLPAFGKLKQWLLADDQEKELRRAERRAGPEVVVHYWDGAAPEGRQIRDISETGAYIYTEERWYLDTIIRMVLQGYRTIVRPDGTTGPANTICVPARVARHGSDGVAVEFIFRDDQEREAFKSFLSSIPAQPPARSSTPLNSRGQSLIEFALMIPLVLLLAVNAANFGGFIYAWITVADAARTGVQYMVLSSASPGTPGSATQAQVTSLITNDVTSLLNRASTSVSVCTNATTAANSCTSLFDPEAPTYTLATVDVTYTYQPFIPLFPFPGLKISATLPTTSIHRKAVMRMVQ